MKNSNNLQSWLAKPNARAKVERELAARSLREFVRQAWHDRRAARRRSSPGWHIDAIIDHLEAVTRGQIRNLLINVPPRHMKSLLVSVFWPAWEWIRHPRAALALQQLCARTLSMRDSVKCRRLIESPWYQALLGRPLCAHQRPEHKGALRQQPLRLSLVDLRRRLGDRRRRRPDRLRRPAQGR